MYFSQTQLGLVSACAHMFELDLRFVHVSLACRWLICTLAVRFFQTALNADLKIKSVGLFSVQGVSIQFHPQHTLVRHTVYTTCMPQAHAVSG